MKSKFLSIRRGDAISDERPRNLCVQWVPACTSGSLEPSHVLRAMKVPFTAVHGSVRFSLSRYNTKEEIDHIIAVFPEIVGNLRLLSPYWDVQKNRPRPDAEKMAQKK